MSRVNVSKEVRIHLETEELDVLEKAHGIIKDLRHELFLADDDSEEYYDSDNAEYSLRHILENAGRFVKA